MYQLDWIQRVRILGSPWSTGRARSGLGVSANVWKLGFTSFFTDISSEMVSSILPLYFVAYLHFSPLEFGVLDGIYQGAAVALLSLAAGVFADRRRAQKQVAVAGYGLSALSKLALLLVGAHWPWAVGTLAADRVGKGIRTAPRDAIISLSSHPDNLATAFAVHRGLDAGGAIVGPLAAFLLLRLVPGGFDLVMFASFGIALIGLGLIALLVRKPRVSVPGPAAGSLSFQACLGLWKHPPLRVLIVAGGLLGLMTASDGFIYLALQKSTHSPGAAFPLFAFVTATVYVIVSLPAGKLADRWGRSRVFLAGNAMLIPIYSILLMPGLGTRAPLAILGLLGVYYATTDGVLAAMASAVLEPEFRTSGLALLNTFVSCARFASSLLFGMLWGLGTVSVPIWTFLVGLLVAICASGWVLRQKRVA